MNVASEHYNNLQRILNLNYLQKFKISGPGMLLVCSGQEIGGATADES